jgi:hypothetical protein
LQEIIEPRAKHVSQSKQGEQGRVSRERLLAELVGSLTEASVDVEQVRRLLAIARRAGLDWRDLFAEAVAVRQTSRPDLPDLLLVPGELEPLG